MIKPLIIYHDKVNKQYKKMENIDEDNLKKIDFVYNTYKNQ